MTLPPEGAPALALEVAAIAIASLEGEFTSAVSTLAVPLRSAAIQPAPFRMVEPGSSPLVKAAPAARAEPGSSPFVAPAPAATTTPGSFPPVEPAPSPPAQPAHPSIPLRLDLQVLRGDGPFDAVIVRDLPAGAGLSAGTYDPAIAGWVLLPHHLRELRVITGSGHPAEFTLCLLGVCLQAGGGARPRLLARVPVTIG